MRQVPNLGAPENASARHRTTISVTYGPIVTWISTADPSLATRSFGLLRFPVGLRLPEQLTL
jgi:hypothetical protein